MGIFNTPNNQEKTDLLSLYSLDHLSDPADQSAMRCIISQLATMNLNNPNNPLGGVQVERIGVFYQRAIFEQNNIIIRQLERLNRNLEAQTSPEG